MAIFAGLFLFGFLAGHLALVYFCRRWGVGLFYWSKAVKAVKAEESIEKPRGG